MQQIETISMLPKRRLTNYTRSQNTGKIKNVFCWASKKEEARSGSLRDPKQGPLPASYNSDGSGATPADLNGQAEMMGEDCLI